MQVVGKRKMVIQHVLQTESHRRIIGQMGKKVEDMTCLQKMLTAESENFSKC